uniref:reverse transcriptase domain-containing protein n=1 Tax=Okeania sp. SIO2F4 TaxID=2607790 RepID=UPI003429A7F9
MLDLVGQYLRRFVSDGGIYVDIQRGIFLGYPLSPLMGALYLKPLDDWMAAMGCFYVRYMDDWVVLAPTRWALRRAIKATNMVMGDLKVEKHPEKTFIKIIWVAQPRLLRRNIFGALLKSPTSPPGRG